jgi:hypothetical protein
LASAVNAPVNDAAANTVTVPETAVEPAALELEAEDTAAAVEPAVAVAWPDEQPAASVIEATAMAVPDKVRRCI